MSTETTIRLPPHKCGLYLTHNEHRDTYTPLATHIDDLEMAGDFESPEAMHAALASDELWTLQWYPDTPVGFFRVAAPTLADVLRMANAHGND